MCDFIFQVVGTIGSSSSAGKLTLNFRRGLTLLQGNFISSCDNVYECDQDRPVFLELSNNGNLALHQGTRYGQGTSTTF
jgi:hypothetical protein